MARAELVLPSIPRVARISSQGEPMPFAPVCAIFRRYLKGQRLKFTPERAAILDTALRHEGLFSAEMLVDDLIKAGHRASRATVYRTLTHLHDAGILKQVFFDNKQSYFEVITAAGGNDYLVCVESGRVVEFRSAKLTQLVGEICREHGYEPIGHQLQIFGVRAG